MAPDLEKLREQYPDWHFGVAWSARASGPDYRTLWAYKNGVLLAATTAAGLREQLADVT